MILAHKTRINPTPEQERYLWQAVGTARFTWNYCLARWDKEYVAGNNPSAYGIKKLFNAAKREEFPWIYDVCKSIPENAIMNLGKAFNNFFRDVKSGNQVGYPRFKSRRNPLQSFQLANDRFTLDGNEFRLKNKKFPGVLNMAEQFPFVGKITWATISHKAGHWYLSINVDLYNIEQPLFGPQVGVDLGIKSLAVTSDGEVFENQKALRTNLDKLAKMQRHMERKVKGSVRWRKMKLKVGKRQEKIANIRRDAQHKLTTYLCKTYGHIAIEDLHVSGMMKNRKLARAIADCGWFEIRRQLEYKGKLYGAVIAVIDRWFPSSKTHSKCGYHNSELILADRVWWCSVCDELVLRDENAAQNILAYSLTRA